MGNERPNVLLILTDQQRADTIGALGNPVIKTPNLDRLCREGTAFTSAYTPNPVCVPARCSLMYGQYPTNTGCYGNQLPWPQDGRLSIPGTLTKAGYKTRGIGKMHIMPDRNDLCGFQGRDRQEEFVHEVKEDEYMADLHAAGFESISAPHGVRGEMYYMPQPSSVPAEHHPTQWVGNKSIDFIRENNSSAGNDPWFLFTSFIHPHPPFSPPSPWHDLYHAPFMPLPKVPDDWEKFHTWINTHQNRYKYRDQGWDLNVLRCMKAYYYACISFIDFQVGRLLKELEETNQLDNTLILYTSDHGEFLGDYRCFGKRNMLDAASNVPMLARFPKSFEANSVCSKPVNLVDIFPTITTATGTSPDSHKLDGENLASIAKGSTKRSATFSQFDRNEKAIYMIVTDEWKYFYSAADNREFLFNRKTDPDELRNQDGTLLTKGVQKSLRDDLVQHLKEIGEENAIDGDAWKKYLTYSPPINPDAGLGRRQQGWADMSIPGYTN